VLPFVNMSGDKEQDYFSDGLSDELLNDLARIDELQVAGRTSSFYFKGKDVDLETIARKLNVGAILEGSVRRSEHTVRVTAQLINSATGFHLWSETYDRDLGDVLKLETDIAHAVAGAMKVTLLGDVAEKVELGGTRNPAALDAYLHASQAFHNFGDATELRAAIAAFTEAIRLDPSYALALANRSVALTMYAAGYTDGPEIRNSFDAAQVDARKAIASAPDLAESHAAMGYFLEAGSLDFRRALEEYERAVALSPGNTFALQGYGRFAVLMGRTQAGVAAARRAVTLNPLDPFARSMLCQTLFFARQYAEAKSACQESVALNPADPDSYLYRGLSQHALGNSYEARLSCEAKPVDAAVCLAIAYNSLGRHTDAEAVLTKLKASKGNDAAYEYGEIYAQWGNTASALESLEAALRVRESWLVDLKTDPLLDPVRTEPRFQAIERELKFPD
jgi:serine/threonine-protein kinase